MFGPERPETKIVRRMIRAREIRSMTQRDVAERVDSSSLYGSFTHGSYRNLERTNFESGAAPRTALNVMLVKAIAEALGMPVNELATPEELSALRDKPYRRSQWPISLQNQDRESAPKGRSVPAPTTTAKRLYAYMRQYRYSFPDFARMLTENGHRISAARLRDALNPEKAEIAQRVITYEFCEKAARAFRGRLNRGRFDVSWLIMCNDRCPHCDPRLIDV